LPFFYDTALFVDMEPFTARYQLLLVEFCRYIMFCTPEPLWN